MILLFIRSIIGEGQGMSNIRGHDIIAIRINFIEKLTRYEYRVNVRVYFRNADQSRCFRTYQCTIPELTETALFDAIHTEIERNSIQDFIDTINTKYEDIDHEPFQCRY